MFLGLDFETSGADIDDGAVPIQVGIASFPFGDAEVFVRDIGSWNWTDEPWVDDHVGGRLATWSEDAYDVHRIPRERLRAAPSAGLVDVWAAAEVERIAGNVPRPWRNVVGWNVAGFDLAFAKRFMPETMKKLSYRTVDLNAIVFSIAGDSVGDYHDVKKEAKDYAAAEVAATGLFDGDQWHDAGYDALAALYAFEYLHNTYTRPRLEEW